MNNKIRTTLLGGLLSASIASPLLAGDFATPITAEAASPFSFATGYHTTYVWRGIDFGNEMADWSLEASKTVGSFDLTAGVWGANVFTLNGGSEVDLYASASKDLGFATLDLGYIFYYFDGATANNTQEAYLSLGKDVAGVSLSATYYYDFDLTGSSYLEFGASKTLTLGGFGDLDLSVALGFDAEDANFTHVQPTISKSFDLNSEVSLTPYVSYSYAIEDTDSAQNARKDEFIAGISLGFSF